MLFSLAEKAGLINLMAPCPTSGGEDHTIPSCAPLNRESSERTPARTMTTSKESCQCPSSDRRSVPLKDTKYRRRGSTGNVETGRDTKRRLLLRTQQASEKRALSRGVFAKYHRVRYHNKSARTDHDAVVMAVHFDDGPDRPYYTIRYEVQDIATEDPTKKVCHVVEKQTTPDRLMALAWDDAAAWKILSECGGR